MTRGLADATQFSIPCVRHVETKSGVSSISAVLLAGTDHVPNEGTAFDQATLAQELQKECLRVLKASDNIGTPRETGSGFFEAGAYLPDVGSISLSFPRIRALLPWTPEFPVAR